MARKPQSQRLYVPSGDDGGRGKGLCGGGKKAEDGLQGKVCRRGARDFAKATGKGRKVQIKTDCGTAKEEDR